MEAHARGRLDAVVHCGPVAIGVTAETPALRDRALAELEQFTARWDDPCALIRVHLHTTDEPVAMGEGRFLHCSGIRVDQAPSGLIATCRSGGSGIYAAARREWDLYIHPASFAPAARPLDGPTPVATPAAEDGAWTEDNIEDLLELILTTAWREVGWIALHSGAVVSARRCALLMAPAKGGKSTLTAAMLHRGWRTLGDDKLLIGLGADGQPEVRGLATEFNLDPRTSTWFPELGDLESLPRLSSWTPKRRVSIAGVWGDCVADRAVPTHVVLIRRVSACVPTRVERLGPSEVLSALLHQTVVPADPATAKRILTVVARSARTVRGVRVEIGDDVYRDPCSLDALEEQLA
jgi:hypothetical protein